MLPKGRVHRPGCTLPFGSMMTLLELHAGHPFGSMMTLLELHTGLCTRPFGSMMTLLELHTGRCTLPFGSMMTLLELHTRAKIKSNVEFSACHLATFHDRSGEVIVLSDSEDSVVVIDSDSEAVFKTDLPKAEDNNDDVRIPLK